MGKSRTVIKPSQYGLSIGATNPVALTVPAGAYTSHIFVRTAPVVFTLDGQIPTASKGVQADPYDIINLNSRDELVGFRGIALSTALTVDVFYYSDVSG